MFVALRLDSLEAYNSSSLIHLQHPNFVRKGFKNLTGSSTRVANYNFDSGLAMNPTDDRVRIGLAGKTLDRIMLARLAFRYEII